MGLCPSGERRNEQAPAETNKAFTPQAGVSNGLARASRRVPIEYRFHCLTQGDFSPTTAGRMVRDSVEFRTLACETRSYEAP